MSNQALIRKSFGINEEMVTSLDDAIRIGEIVAKSKMFPEVTDQAKAVVAILAGRELGIPPMASLRGIHVVKGKVEIGAGLLAAMIKQSGKYAYAVVKSDDTECFLHWYENGQLVGHTKFTIDDAKRAKLIKPDSQWEKFPRAMLFARALTEGQKKYCPEIGIGAVYGPGEIQADDTIDIPSKPPLSAGRAIMASPDVKIEIPTAQEIFDTPRPLPDTSLPAAWKDSSIAREIADQEIANKIGAELKAIFNEIKAEAPVPDPIPLKYDQKNRAHSPDIARSMDAAIKRLVAFGVKGEELLAETQANVERPITTRYELTDTEAEPVIEMFQKWADALERKRAEAQNA